MGFGLPRGMMAGFAPRWQEIQEEKKDRAAKIAELRREKQKEDYKNLLASYPVVAFRTGKQDAPPALISTLQARGMKPEDIEARLYGHAAFKKGAEKKSFNTYLKSAFEGKVLLQNPQRVLMRHNKGLHVNPMELLTAQALTDPKHPYHKEILNHGGSPRALLNTNRKKYQQIYRTSALDEASKADKKLLVGPFKWGIGEYLPIDKEDAKNSSLLGRGAFPKNMVFIGKDGSAPDMQYATYTTDYRILEQINSHLDNNPHLKALMSNDKNAQNKLRNWVSSISGKPTTLGGTRGPTPSEDTHYGVFGHIGDVVSAKVNKQQVGQALHKAISKGPTKITQNNAVPTSTTRAKEPKTLLKDSSTAYHEWREDQKISVSDHALVLVDALNLDYEHKYVKENMGNIYSANTLSFEANKKVATMWQDLQKAPRGSALVNVMVKDATGTLVQKQVTAAAAYDMKMKNFVEYWAENVSTPSATMTDTLAELYQASAIAADWKAGHYSPKQTVYGTQGISEDIYLNRAWKLGERQGEKAEQKHIDAKKKIEKTVGTMRQLSDDVRSLLRYMTENNTEKLDDYYATVAPDRRVFGPARKMRSKIIDFYEYARELLGYVGKDEDLEKALGNKELNSTNRSIIMAQSKRARRFMQDIQNGSLDPKYQMAAIAEFKKLALTYRLSGMVQGETSGGRTISNQDFEVMLKALWGGTQQGNQARLQSLLQRIDMAIMTGENEIFLKTRGTYDKVQGRGTFHDRLQKAISSNYDNRLIEEINKHGGQVSTQSLIEHGVSISGIKLSSRGGFDRFTKNTIPDYYGEVASSLDKNRLDINVTDTLAEKYPLIRNEDELYAAAAPSPDSALDLNNKESIREHMYYRGTYLPRTLATIAFYTHSYPKDEGYRKMFRQYYKASSEYINNEAARQEFIAMLTTGGMPTAKARQYLEGYSEMFRNIFNSVYK